MAIDIEQLHRLILDGKTDEVLNHCKKDKTLITTQGLHGYNVAHLAVMLPRVSILREILNTQEGVDALDGIDSAGNKPVSYGVDPEVIPILARHGHVRTPSIQTPPPTPQPLQTAQLKALYHVLQYGNKPSWLGSIARYCAKAGAAIHFIRTGDNAEVQLQIDIDKALNARQPEPALNRAR